MKLEEWTKAVCDELTAAGFAAEVYQGFPLVRTKPDKRLLDFQLTLSVEKRIYAEGMLFVPVGSPR